MGRLSPRYRLNMRSILMGGGICSATALSVRIFSTEPYYVWRLISSSAGFPPLWLSSLLWLAVNFLTGALLGHILSGRLRAGRACAVFRGGIYLVLSLTAGLMWYCLLFGGRSFVFSLLLVLAACAMAGLCGVCLWECERLAAVVSFVLAVWYLLVFLGQMRAVLFS